MGMDTDIHTSTIIIMPTLIKLKPIIGTNIKMAENEKEKFSSIVTSYAPFQWIYTPQNMSLRISASITVFD